MKEFNLLIWVTQLGFSIAVPMAVSVFGAVWLQEKFQLGRWIVILGVVVGAYCAVDGFIRNLKALNRMSDNRSSSAAKDEETKHIQGFNSHD